MERNDPMLYICNHDCTSALAGSSFIRVKKIKILMPQKRFTFDHVCVKGFCEKGKKKKVGKKRLFRVKAQTVRTYKLWDIPPRNGEKNSSRTVTSLTK